MLSFPATQTAEKQYKCSDVELRQCVRDAIQLLGWQIEFDLNDIIHAKVGINILSWGERITIETAPKAVLRITSRCAFTAQCFDWGKNHRNIVSLFDRVSLALLESRQGIA